MFRFTLVGFVALIACSSKSGAPARDDEPATRPAAAGMECPMPKDAGITERFAVGAIPDYRVSSLGMAEAPRCHDEFTPNDVLVMGGGQPKLVKEGTFQGRCKGDRSGRTFQAVKPDRVVVEISALHKNAGGELGLGKPAILDSQSVDSALGVTARVVDRCGTPLSVGLSRNVTTWKPRPGCEKVVKLAPYELTGPGDPSSAEMQIFPVGAGACTIELDMLGVTGALSVKVN